MLGRDAHFHFRRGQLGSICLLALLLCMARTPVGVYAASYSSHFTGTVEAYRLSGVEPDGDPLYQVALRMRLPASASIPTTTLVISAYLENFSPDTTPILPDLLHPKQIAHNLGGYLDGKMILVDDAGNTLGTGLFFNEAFLNNTNHTVLTFFTDVGHVTGGLRGTFTLGRKGSMNGQLSGALHLSAGALAQVGRDRGKPMKPLKQILDQVTVHPHYYGARGVHAKQPAYHTGFGSGAASGGGSSSHRLSPVTVLAGLGAAISLVIAGVLYWLERRGRRSQRSVE